MGTFQDERRHGRIETDATLDYLGADVLLEHRIEDLSAGGLNLCCGKLEPVGTRVLVTINFPDFQDAITVQARVARHTGGARPGMGLEFVDLGESERAALQRYLAERAARLSK